MAAYPLDPAYAAALPVKGCPAARRAASVLSLDWSLRYLEGRILTP